MSKQIDAVNHSLTLLQNLADKFLKHYNDAKKDADDFGEKLNTILFPEENLTEGAIRPKMNYTDAMKAIRSAAGGNAALFLNSIQNYFNQVFNEKEPHLTQEMAQQIALAFLLKYNEHCEEWNRTIQRLAKTAENVELTLISAFRGVGMEVEPNKEMAIQPKIAGTKSKKAQKLKL